MRLAYKAAKSKNSKSYFNNFRFFVHFRMSPGNWLKVCFWWQNFKMFASSQSCAESNILPDLEPGFRWVKRIFPWHFLLCELDFFRGALGQKLTRIGRIWREEGKDDDQVWQQEKANSSTLHLLGHEGGGQHGDSGKDHGEDEESQGQIKDQIMLQKLLLFIPARMESS